MTPGRRGARVGVWGGVGLAGAVVVVLLLAQTLAAAAEPTRHTTTTRRQDRAAATTTTTAAPPLTSCQSAVIIGDSTSESLISDAYLNPAQQLPAQMQRVGVKNVNLQISGARSIVETLPGQLNAQEVAQQLLAQGYHGCWVLALGTNDSANVGAGSVVGLAPRIHDMMALIGDQPVMWVNVLSLVTSGAYAESNMAAWDQALLQACPQYSNMRVYNWAAVAQNQPGWFISDGIHYNSEGSAIRAADIADALAAAFPAARPSASKHPASSARRATSLKRTTRGHPHTASAHRDPRLHRSTTTTTQRAASTASANCLVS